MITLGVARDISLILLMVPACLCAMLPAAIVFGSWWGVRKVRRGLPRAFRTARSGVRRTRDGIDGATRVITRPIFFGESWSARLRAMWRRLAARG
jgi:hypothetical protein